MDVSIQVATVNQLKGIHALVQEWGYAVSESETLEWLQALIASSNHQVFVAVAGESVLGWISAEQRISLGHGVVSEITGLVVGSMSRRLGIGRLLVAATEDWSRKLGLSQVVVRSNVRRVEAHAFYPSIGFELTKTTNVYEKEFNGLGKTQRSST